MRIPPAGATPPSISRVALACMTVAAMLALGGCNRHPGYNIQGNPHVTDRFKPLDGSTKSSGSSAAMPSPPRKVGKVTTIGGTVDVEQELAGGAPLRKPAAPAPAAKDDDEDMDDSEQPKPVAPAKPKASKPAAGEAPAATPPPAPAADPAKAAGLSRAKAAIAARSSKPPRPTPKPSDALSQSIAQGINTECEEFLKEGAQDAREWLKNGQNTLAKMDPKTTKEWVEAFYEAGAKKVHVAQIKPGEAAQARTLVVELHDDAAQARSQCLDVFQEMINDASNQTVDHGQKYLMLHAEP